MHESPLSHRACLAKLTTHLKAERYSRGVMQNYPYIARRFLDHLDKQGLTVHTVQPADVNRYIRFLQAVRKRRGRASPELRKFHRAAIHRLLHVVRGRWPPESAATSEREAMQRRVLRGYEEWMRDVYGFALSTRAKYLGQARQFLSWWAERTTEQNLSAISVRQLDTYLQERSGTLTRRSLAGLVEKLRPFLRYLHFSGLTPANLSAAVRGPKIYKHEGIPSALNAEDVRQVVETSRRARSPIGRRDHAMCSLMAAYGLRAGEIVGLRLEDIDWRNEVLHIRHLKTNHCSQLPLLRGPADALLKYLRHGRPQTTAREVFVRALAPYRSFKGATGLYHTIHRHLSGAGKERAGKKGSHAFRHARAVGLLRAAVPLKTIGDVLGHRSPRSTMVYLKLAMQDLRAVALDVPGEVSL